MTSPSVPLRSAPLHSAVQRKGQLSSSSVPVPSPSHREGTGNGRGEVTKGQMLGGGKDPLPLHSQASLPEEGFWPPVPISEIAELWTVLRCASAATVELAEELREEGLIAWAPMIRVQKRLPRRRKTELVVRSLLPSFVFVAKQHGDEAIDLATRGRVHQCKRFLFNVDEVIIPGIQLGPLHQAQIRGTLRNSPLVAGDGVEILATMLYLVKGRVVSGPRRSDSYEVELEGQNQRVIFPGFLLRKTLT